jgi:hypothetical protein
VHAGLRQLWLEIEPLTSFHPLHSICRLLIGILLFRSMLILLHVRLL